MNYLQIIEGLCGVCADMARIISEQQKVLAQHNALAMEGEIATTRSQYLALTGDFPDALQEGGEPDVH